VGLDLAGKVVGLFVWVEKSIEIEDNRRIIVCAFNFNLVLVLVLARTVSLDESLTDSESGWA
jgi:hypothetical protein